MVAIFGATDPAVWGPRGERVRIAKHTCGLRLVHPAGHDPYRLLRAKLGWSEPPR